MTVKNKNANELIEVHFVMLMFYVMFWDLVYLIFSFYLKQILNSNLAIYLNPLFLLYYINLIRKDFILSSTSEQTSGTFVAFAISLLNISLFVIFFDIQLLETITVLLLTFFVFVFSGINIFK